MYSAGRAPIERAGCGETGADLQSMGQVPESGPRGWSRDGKRVGFDFGELDAEHAAAVRELFKDVTNLDLKLGDWHKALKDVPPFDLVFMDAGMADDIAGGDWGPLVESVKIGGQIVFDDIVPVELFPPEWQDILDHKREFAFNNPHVLAVEVRTTPITAALILTRIK